MSADAPTPEGPQPDPLEVPPSPSAPLIPADLRGSAWRWLRAAAVAITVYVGYQMLVVLGGVVKVFLAVVLYVVFGAIISFLVGPLVDVLTRFVRLPRTVAILAILLGALALLAGGVYLAAGPAVNEARTLADPVPDLIHRLNGELEFLRNSLRGKGIDVSALDLSGSGNDLGNRIKDVLLTTVGGTVSAVVDVIIVFVVAFWLLKDGELLRAGLLSLLPGRVRNNVSFGLDAVGVVIGGYVRAQLLLALIIGTMAGVGCAILGVPFPIVVALAAGVFELIPIVGPFVGGAVAILLALTVSGTLAVLTVGLFVLIHVIEGYVLGPRIQAKFVRLHPLVSLLALFAGIDVGGFLGALFAVPLASLAAVFVRAAIGDVRASRPELYAHRGVDQVSERRRATILGEFRLFKTSPLAMARARVGLGRGDTAGGAGAAPGSSRSSGGPPPEEPASGDQTNRGVGV